MSYKEQSSKRISPKQIRYRSAVVSSGMKAGNGLPLVWSGLRRGGTSQKEKQIQRGGKVSKGSRRDDEGKCSWRLGKEEDMKSDDPSSEKGKEGNETGDAP